VDQADARSFAAGEEITLMDWGNAIVDVIDRPDPTGDVMSLKLTLHLEGDFKKTEKKVTWLATDQSLVPVELLDFDYLITKNKLEEDDDVANFVNKETLFRKDALADESVALVKEDDIIQFERKGYYRCDKAAGTKGEKAVFFMIPTGKSERASERG
jgi:glutamyl-tRNA synthetase